MTATQKQADRILQLAGALELFHDPEGVPYAAVPGEAIPAWDTEGDRAVKISSGLFLSYLTWLYYHETGECIQQRAVRVAQRTLAARAVFENKEQIV